MGYYVQQKETSVTITKANWDKLHIDHPELFMEKPEHDGLFTELFDVDTRYDNGDVISLGLSQKNCRRMPVCHCSLCGG